jgi:hypothetical protein
MMENPGPACLDCVGLNDLEFLRAGDARLSRHAKAKCVRYAVVVRFSRTRRRYERQGLLVKPSPLADALNLLFDSPLGAMAKRLGRYKNAGLRLSQI